MSPKRRERSGVLAAAVGLLFASCALSASCGVSLLGTGSPDGGGPNGSDADASSDRDAHTESSADGGVAPGDDAGADASDGCIVAAPSMLGWWAADGDMTDRVGGHDGVSGAQAGATAVAFTAGKLASAFDLRGASYVQIANAANLQITSAITIDAWIEATALGGRIVDKITAGGADGYMLDTYQSKLRLILGGKALSSPATLPLGAWVHVAATWDGATARLFVNGSVVVSAAIAGPIPKTTLALRLGADATGNTRFSGKVDEVGIYGLALSSAEISAIHAAGPSGRCKP